MCKTKLPALSGLSASPAPSLDYGVKFPNSTKVCDLFGTELPPFSATADLPGKPTGQLWFPHENNASENWINTLEQGEDFIVEISLKEPDHVAKTTSEDRTRLVFMKMEGDEYYTFLGVYVLNANETNKRGHCVWVRISENYPFIAVI